MSYWYVIVPESTQNMVLNPSAEEAGNFAAFLGGSMSRVAAYGRYGLYSYRIQTVADDEGGTLTLDTLDNAIHYVTVRVRGTLPPAWDWSLDNATYNEPTLLESLDANWSLYGCQFPAAQANGSTTLYVCQDGAGSGDFYVDAVQVEEKEYWTTYCDGDQEGCAWNGAEHASTSTRSAGSAAGGRQMDLQEDYSFDVGGMIGLGDPPQRVVVDEYAVLPGGEINMVKILPRSFTLIGVTRGTNMSDLHSKLSALSSVLRGPGGCRDVRLRYTGATTHKELAAVYEGGMEGDIQATGICHWQRMALRFIAEDPYWHDYGGTGGGGSGCSAALDTNDSATLRYVTGRLKSTGQWDDLGLTNNPTGGGTVYAILVASDGIVYVGGSFTGFNGVAGRDYIASYNPSTDSWSTVGGASDFNGDINVIIEGSDGTIYAGGAFQDCGADPNADFLAQWDGATWSAVAAGCPASIRALVFGLDGTLYIGGSFTDWGDANGDGIVQWNGAAISSLGSGLNATVYDLAVDGGDILYAGGSFTASGATTLNRIAQWDGSTWSTVYNSTGMDLTVYALAISSAGILYAGGDFTTIDGESISFLGEWNGTAWTALGSGLNGQVRRLVFGSNNILYVGGVFTAAGGITLTDRIAKWNGASWAHLDIDIPGSPTIWAIDVGPSDAVIGANYDIYFGFSATGTGYFAGTATATNDGTVAVHPIIVFRRSGGTSATIYQVRNESTGKELLFDYSLLDGETLTVDLRPTRQSIVSSMFGPRPDAVLANSDMGSFTLQSGDNQVTAFVNVVGAPTVTAWIEWRTQYGEL